MNIVRKYLYLVFFLPAGITSASAQELPEKYSEKMASTFYIRAAQKMQLQAFLDSRIKETAGTAASHFRPDYSSPDAYARSVEAYRQRLKEMIGYPPPGAIANGQKRIEFVGEDKLCKIYRIWIEVLPGVEAHGIYMVPQKLKKPAPLVICSHGGGGCPEYVCNIEHTGNYGDMARRALERGYITWAPMLIFTVGGANDPEIYGADRMTLDRKAKLIGTSIVAIEIYKIVRGMETIMEFPEADPARIGMMGLSYGGFYTLFAAAIEPRIKAAVSSCYWNDRADIFGQGLMLPDLHFMGLLNIFQDPQVAGLICPRALMVEVGINDTLFKIDGARKANPGAEYHYSRLGIGSRYSYAEHDGTHEFRGESAYDFLDAHLKD